MNLYRCESCGRTFPPSEAETGEDWEPLGPDDRRHRITFPMCPWCHNDELTEIEGEADG